MKILVVPSWYLPNGGRFFKYQAEALAQKGHQVDLLTLEEIGITTKINDKLDHHKSTLINEIRSKYYRIPKWNALNSHLFIKKFKKELIKYLEENSPDVIHVQSVIWAGVVVADVALEKNIPYVISEFRSLFFKTVFPFNIKLKNKIMFALNHAAEINAVSNGMKNILQNYTSNKISIIPNMVDVGLFKLDVSISKSDVFTFLSVGNLIPLKGFDVLIKSFKLLISEYPVNLKIIGVGTQEKELKNYVKQHHLESEIQFLGYKTKGNLIEEYNKAQAYVSASLIETFGMTIIEAMSCGLPVIATKSAGGLDIVNKQNGIQAKPNNVQDLYNCMKEMYLNYSNFDGNLIRKEIINKYSTVVVVEMIEKSLLNAMNKE